ncbi:MAG: isochorismatase family protein, partial [Planctomycetes bacterium]|nr:isochorismatase family protein [Planctomycetota bacterium]
MVKRGNGRVYDCVAIDLNTQTDFCVPNGAYPVANLEEVIPALRRVIAWTKWHGLPVVSSLDSHRPCDLPNEDGPMHCVDGSHGQHKIPFTLFGRLTQVEVDNTLSIPLNLFNQYQQVLFRMRTDDLLANPKADRFLTQVSAAEFVVFGNTVEHSVKALVLGLVGRNKSVTVVQDACGYWNRGAADLAFRQMIAKGCRLTTV